MGRVQGGMHAGERSSQVQLEAPGETRGREGLVRGRGALDEPGCNMRSSGEEALEGREAGGWGHSKVHNCADCSKCQNLAQERSQQEVEGGERGAHARSKEGHMSL